MRVYKVTASNRFFWQTIAVRADNAAAAAAAFRAWLGATGNQRAESEKWEAGEPLLNDRDEDIDTSDIPELNDSFFQQAILTRPGEDIVASVRAAKQLKAEQNQRDDYRYDFNDDEVQVADELRVGTSVEIIDSGGNG